MKVTLVSLAPTDAATAAGRPALTPELLAASGARYSRNNEGLDSILQRIDPENRDASVDSIFRMLDYGHQSIADMVPVAIFIDNISIQLAWQLWYWSPQAGGQECSTRYIRLTPEGLIDPGRLGIPAALRAEWHQAMSSAYNHYNAIEAGWQKLAEAAPTLMRLPASLLADTSERAAKQVARIRRNFAFDRARYWLPAAAATNVMLVMSARAWATLCQHLRSAPQQEANLLGAAIAKELELGAPRLLRHATAKESIRQGLADELAELVALAQQQTPCHLREESDDPAHPATASLALLTPPDQSHTDFAAALQYHDNRYAWLGAPLRRTAVRFAWQAVAFGDIRDLNRHRTGQKYTPLLPLGFYGAADQLPTATPEAPEAAVAAGLKFGRDLTRLAHARLAANDPHYTYWTLLGTQYYFEHVTTADKFIYEAELRTGLGAHFRYARHLHDALDEWYALAPETRGLVLEGSAEPE